MKNVQVRSVPETTHRILKKRAAEKGMSLQEYLLKLLKDHASEPTNEEIFARISRGEGGRTGSKARLADIVADIRADRESR
jgi:plasmid stability protein